MSTKNTPISAFKIIKIFFETLLIAVVFLILPFEIVHAADMPECETWYPNGVMCKTEEDAFEYCKQRWGPLNPAAIPGNHNCVLVFRRNIWSWRPIYWSPYWRYWRDAGLVPPSFFIKAPVIKVDDPKNQGCPASCSGIGNPANASNGNKYQKETDYVGNNTGLSFIRHYNSGLGAVDKGMGFGWVHQSMPRLEVNGTDMTVWQSDGRGEPFKKQNASWQGDADSHIALVQDSSGYTLSYDNGTVERYDPDGYLLSKTDLTGKQTLYRYRADHLLDSITGPFGHLMQFSYNSDNRIESVTVPGGEQYQYDYDSDGNLVKVTYPDNRTRRYHYENSEFKHALTGITDENGDRYATFGYDADGNAILTEHAQTDNSVPQERFNLSYDSDTQTTVTDAAGTVRVLTFAENLGVKNLLTRINQTDGKGITRSYDAKNNLISRTDAEGHITHYVYNDTNQRIRTLEAQGTAQERITDTQYLSPDLDLPVRSSTRSVFDGHSKQTESTYNSNHTLAQITVNGFTPDGDAISRSTQFQYNNLGQITHIDGPQPGTQDSTTLSYYDCNTGAECGQLASITNALGQTTVYQHYDSDGRLLTMTDANGLSTQYQYDSRGRITQLTQTPPSGQGQPRITAYQYDAAGQLSQVTRPDGIILNYQYDAAHDLRSITDNQGNRVNYGYDAKGIVPALKPMMPAEIC